MTQDYWENLYQMVSNRYVVVAAAAAAAAAVIVSDHFSGPGRALGLLCVSVCVPGQYLSNEMAFVVPVHVSSHDVGQVRRSRSQVRVRRHRMKNVLLRL